MEYFIGIIPPPEYIEKVISFQKQWKNNGVVNVVEPHITLKAQGGLSPDLNWLDELEKLCARVAVNNNEVVGFVLGMIDQTNTSHAYLNYLFVKEDYRKTGIGKRLMEQFETTALNRGCEFVTLLTSKNENIAYYQRLGYEKNNDLEQFSQNDAVYDYYYNTKKVSLLIKIL